MINLKQVKIGLAIVIILNLILFAKYYWEQEKKVKDTIEKHQIIPKLAFDDEIDLPLGRDYKELNPKEKIAALLKKVDNDKERFWEADVSITESSVKLDMKHFLPFDDVENFASKAELFFDPRFTLSIYLDEIKSQLLAKNPHNTRQRFSSVTVPFEWSDWVDLTMLNSELNKPVDERLNCDYLTKNMNKPTKHPKFCKNLVDVSEEDLKEMQMPSKEFLPGFIVKESPMNKAPHEVVMMQGKAHLFSYQQIPISIVFLTKNGTYEASVSEKKRIVRSDLLKNFLHRRNFKTDDKSAFINNITFDTEAELNSILSEVKPRPLELSDDPYRMLTTARQKDPSANRELHLPTDLFMYGKEEVKRQIKEYKDRLHIVNDMLVNEIHFDEEKMKEVSLTKHENLHLNGLIYSRKVAIKDEPTYYKLATLKKDKVNKDKGWHYEWRFFDGALRYPRPGWNEKQMEHREQIILDRLLRNWFRFAEEKGIISWIAHGPLLSWYWDALMFPFDIDIDIQMPVKELNRLSRNYNMTLVVEDISEGYGKYLIDCSSFIHHRDRAKLDNVIDARFIDIDTGTYIDITGLSINNEPLPPEYDSYAEESRKHGIQPQVYMDRRKHWLNFESINPLRYSQIGGVPVYIPNNVMRMLNHEYDEGTRALSYSPEANIRYYYVPQLRLWLNEIDLESIFDVEKYKEGDHIDREKFTEAIQNMSEEDTVKLLESNDEVLIEYYKTHKLTKIHEIEKRYLLDASLQQSITELKDNLEYHKLTSFFHMAEPLRKPLYDYSYVVRPKHSS